MSSRADEDAEVGVAMTLTASDAHSGICTIYEIGEAGARLFIAMHIEGLTLRQRVAGRPLEPDDLVELALQIAEALAAAHERGIVHRDIKSRNRIVTPQRQVKILDFGQCEALPPEGDDAAASTSPAFPSQLAQHPTRIP